MRRARATCTSGRTTRAARRTCPWHVARAHVARRTWHGHVARSTYRLHVAHSTLHTARVHVADPRRRRRSRHRRSDSALPREERTCRAGAGIGGRGAAEGPRRAAGSHRPRPDAAGPRRPDGLPGVARRTRSPPRSRSSCSRRAATRPTALPASSSAPTTTSPSRSARRSWPRASARCSAATQRLDPAEPVVRYGPITIDSDAARGDRRRPAKSASRRRNSCCCSIWCSTAAGCCRGISSSPTCGAINTRAARARSTCTSAGCARRCRCSPTRSRRSSSSGTSSSMTERRAAGPAHPAMTFRTRSFVSALATAAVTLTVADDDDVVERAAERRRPHRAVAHQRGPPRRRNTVAPAAGYASGARRRSRCAGPPRVGARHLHRRRRHASSAIRQLTTEELQRRSRITATVPKCCRRGARGSASPGATARRSTSTCSTSPSLSATRRRRCSARFAWRCRSRTSATQLAALRRTALVAAAAGLGTALLLAWAASLFLSGRVRTIAEAAKRYADGDFSRPARDYGADEIGTVARVLDESIRDIGRRAEELATDRARMEAILGGMAEGVLVVNDAGARAARQRVPRSGCCGCRTSPKAATTSRSSATRTSPRRSSASLGGGEEGQSLELPLPHGVIVTVRSASVARRPGDRARSSCCTTSPSCAAPIAYAATSWPTSRTSCARRSRRSGDTSKRCSTAAPTPPQSRRFLEIISRHTMRMERLVRDLLRLARLDAGQEPREQRRLFGRARCSSASKRICCTTLEARDVRVEHEIAADAQTVHGDPAELHDAAAQPARERRQLLARGRHVVTMAARRERPTRC